MNKRRVAVTPVAVLGWILVCGVGFLLLRNSDSWFSVSLEALIWQAVITLAIIGLGALIWPWQPRSRTCAAFAIVGVSSLLCDGVLALSQYREEHRSRTGWLSGAFDDFGWHLIIVVALVGLSCLALAWVAYAVVNERS